MFIAASDLIEFFYNKNKFLFVDSSTYEICFVQEKYPNVCEDYLEMCIKI